MSDSVQCGGIMPTPAEFQETQMYVCSRQACGRTCSSREEFFEKCPILRASDLEFRGEMDEGG